MNNNFNNISIFSKNTNKENKIYDIEIANKILLDELENSENKHYNTNYWDDLDIAKNIMSGNVDNLIDTLTINSITNFLNNGGNVGYTMEKKYEYLLVIAIHAMDRAAITGGLYPSYSNRIADYYLRKLSSTKEPHKEIMIIQDAALSFAIAVSNKKNELTLHSYVDECKNYIFTHLTQKIKLEDMAKSIGVSPFYLSRVFKKNTGETLFSYINTQKLEAASLLLTLSNKPISDISHFFQFSNQSYFSKTFTKKYGMTPKKYRTKYRTLNVYTSDVDMHNY